MWERWNGDHGDPGMNSYSHYAFGAVGEWLYAYLAGIAEEPGSVGFSQIAIRPRWAAPLDSVRAVYRSVRGDIGSAWRRRPDGSILVDVTIPANTTGRVYLPADRSPAAGAPGARFEGMRDGRAVFAVEAGTYRFVVSK
jgi:alpha-L-rhamnosidase